MKITRKQLRKIILQEMALSSRPDRQRPPINSDDDIDYSQPNESTLSWVPGKHYIELVERRPGRYKIDVYVGQPNGGMLFSGTYPKRSLFNSREEAIEFYEGPIFSRILSKLRNIG